MCGTGYYAMAKDQLERFRAAVDADHTGAEIAAIVAGLTKQRYTIGCDRRVEDRTARLPEGPPADRADPA